MMQSNSRFQKLAIAAAATIAVGVVSWAAISSITAAVAPSGLTATAGDTQVTLTWNDPNDSTITGYRVLWMEPMDRLVDPSHPDRDSVAIEAGDRFGQSVGIDGGAAVIAAYRGDDSGTAGAFISGSEFGRWTLAAKLTASGADDQDVI